MVLSHRVTAVVDHHVELAMLLGDSSEELGILLIADLDRMSAGERRADRWIDVDPNQVRLRAHVLAQHVESAPAVYADLVPADQTVLDDRQPGGIA